MALDDLLKAAETLLNAGIQPLDFHAVATNGPVVLAWMPAAYGSGLCQMYQVNEAAFVDACSWVEAAFRSI